MLIYRNAEGVLARESLITPVLNPVPSPRGALVGLVPQTKLQAPPNWNTTNQCGFRQFLECQATPNKRKAPYWKLSGDGCP